MISMVFLAHEKRTHIFFTCPPNCGSQFRNPSRHRQALEKTSLELKQIFINTAVPWLEGMKGRDVLGCFACWWFSWIIQREHREPLFINWMIQKFIRWNHPSFLFPVNDSLDVFQFVISGAVKSLSGFPVYFISAGCESRWITWWCASLSVGSYCGRLPEKNPDLSIGFVDDDFIWHDEGCNGHH